MGETETTTTLILHLEANAADEGLCGDVKIQTTPDPALVTCRRCIARMGGAAPTLGALPYTSRAHTLGGFEYRLASTPKGDPLPRPPRWDSLAKAAEHWSRVVDDGAPIRSAFRTEFVQSGGTTDAGIGGREDVLSFSVALEGAFVAERHFPQATVSVEAQRAILEARLCGVPRRTARSARVTETCTVERFDDARLTDEARRRGVQSEPGRVYTLLAAARLARQLGVPVVERDVRLVEERAESLTFAAETVRRARGAANPRESLEAAPRVPLTAAELVPLLAERFGLELTVHQVGVIYRDGMRSMRERLERAGELRPMRRKEQGPEVAEEDARMAIGEWDLESWQEIADHVGRSIRTCQEYAARDDDPLPTRFVLGHTVSKKADVDAWLARQDRSSKRKAVGA